MTKRKPIEEAAAPEETVVFKHPVQVSVSPNLDPPLKPEERLFLKTPAVETPRSKRTQAEIEAGRKAVARAEERLKAKTAKTKKPQEETG